MSENARWLLGLTQSSPARTPRMRAISYSFPQGQDWRQIDAFNPPAIAAE